jgi:hypothetical protein
MLYQFSSSFWLIKGNVRVLFCTVLRSFSHMANYTKMGGLALGGLVKGTGGKFNSELSMLVEELYSSSQELVQKLTAIEQILQGQVLAHADAAKIALNNAQSSSLTEGEKRAEIVRGSQLFELCYAELRNIPVMGSYKAEVAFCVAMSNTLLGRDDLMRQWLKLSREDFEEFLALPDVKGANAGDAALVAGGGYATLLGGIVAFTVLTSTGVGAAVVIGSLIFTGSAYKTTEKAVERVGKKNSLATLMGDQKNAALQALPQVKQIIADLPALPEEGV